MHTCHSVVFIDASKEILCTIAADEVQSTAADVHSVFSEATGIDAAELLFQGTKLTASKHHFEHFCLELSKACVSVVVRVSETY